jgi:hypothetical protein
MKTRGLFGFGCAAALAVGMMTTSAWANLVTNGDFSENASSYSTYPGYSSNTTSTNPASPTDWTITGQVGVNGPGTGFYATNGSPFGPSNDSGVTDFAFMQNASLTTAASLEQTIVTAIGQAYTLTYVAAQRVANTNAAKIETFVMDATDSTLITSQTPGITDALFTVFTLNFVATSTSTEIVFVNTTPINPGAADNTVDVSNVVVNAVPLPAPLGLLCAGTLGLGLLAARRRHAAKL